MDFSCITSCKRSTISILSLCSHIQVQDCQEKANITSIRVSLSFIQKHFASPALRGLKSVWVTSWVKKSKHYLPMFPFPHCHRQHLTTSRTKPFSLAASSNSLSNKFREGIAAGEFQCSAKACSHKLHNWSRQHHSLADLTAPTTALPVSCPRFGGGCSHLFTKKLVCSHLFTKKYLMDPGQGTVRKQVKSMGMITNRCDNHLTCLCHSSSAVSWWCPAWLRSSGDPEPTCIRLQSSSFGYNPALCFSVWGSWAPGWQTAKGNRAIV